MPNNNSEKAIILLFSGRIVWLVSFFPSQQGKSAQILENSSLRDRMCPNTHFRELSMKCVIEDFI